MEKVYFEYSQVLNMSYVFKQIEHVKQELEAFKKFLKPLEEDYDFR